MHWFFALNEACSTFPLYSDLIKVAVLSARENTSLQPCFLYDGQPNALTGWLERRDVAIVPHRSQFYEVLKSLSEEQKRPDVFRIGTGAFLRVDIPEVVAKLGWSDERILYTDCDVMFVSDPEPQLSRIPCRRFAVAPEQDPRDYDHINTGVMVMNIPALHGDRQRFAEFIVDNLERLVATAWDQEAYRLYYKRKLPLLPNGWNRLVPTLNWKPYWGENPAASIIHFHGPKPFHEELIKKGQTPVELERLVSEAYFTYCGRWRRVLESA
jgi:hypothetical protein